MTAHAEGSAAEGDGAATERLLGQNLAAFKKGDASGWCSRSRNRGGEGDRLAEIRRIRGGRERGRRGVGVDLLHPAHAAAGEARIAAVGGGDEMLVGTQARCRETGVAR